MTRLTLITGTCLALAACGSNDTRVTFDGQYFRGGAKAVDRANPSVFEANVRQVSKSPEGARAAIKHEATKYCIRWFGISTVEWEVSPESDPLPVGENDTLLLRGRCVE